MDTGFAACVKKVSGNAVLRTKFGPVREDRRGYWIKLRNKKLRNIYLFFKNLYNYFQMKEGDKKGR